MKRSNCSAAAERQPARHEKRVTDAPSKQPFWWGSTPGTTHAAKKALCTPRLQPDLRTPLPRRAPEYGAWLSIAKFSGRCVVVDCGYLIVVPRPMSARLCDRALMIVPEYNLRRSYAGRAKSLRRTSTPAIIAANPKSVGLTLSSARGLT
jgi:hypothetical protein